MSSIDVRTVERIAHWISVITKTEFPDMTYDTVLSFFSGLRDGVKLCVLLGKVKGRTVDHNRNPRGSEFSEKENIGYFTKGCIEVLPEQQELVPKQADLYDVLSGYRANNETHTATAQQLISTIIALSEFAKTRKLWKGPDLVLPTENDVTETPPVVEEKSITPPVQTSPTESQTPIELIKRGSFKVKEYSHGTRENNIRELKRDLKEYEDRELENVQSAMRKFQKDEETRVRNEVLQEKRQIAREAEDTSRTQMVDIRQEVELKRKELLSHMENELLRREEELEEEYKGHIEKQLQDKYSQQIKTLEEKNTDLKQKLAEAEERNKTQVQEQSNRVLSTVDLYKKTLQEEDDKYAALVKQMKEMNETLDRKRKEYVKKQSQPKPEPKPVVEEIEEIIYEEPTLVPYVKREMPKPVEEPVETPTRELPLELPLEPRKPLEETVASPTGPRSGVSTPSGRSGNSTTSTPTRTPTSGKEVNPKSYSELLNLLSGHYYDDSKSPRKDGPESKPEETPAPESKPEVVPEPTPVKEEEPVLETPVIVQRASAEVKAEVKQQTPIKYEQIILDEQFGSEEQTGDDDDAEIEPAEEIEPADDDDEPVEEPTEPVVVPTPVEEPTKAVEPIKESVEEPTEPVEEPIEPVEPTKPIETPEPVEEPVDEPKHTKEPTQEPTETPTEATDDLSTTEESELLSRLESISPRTLERQSSYRKPLPQAPTTPTGVRRESRALPTAPKKRTPVKIRFGEALPQLIPDFINQAITYLEQHAMSEEGLFRLAGNVNDIAKMKETLHSGESVDMNIVNHVYIHNIASLIKIYLRELPNPLCTHDLYDMFVASNTIPQTSIRLGVIKKVLTYLPKNHLNLLAKICIFLNSVRQNSDVNKMTSKNLAIVFAPNILVTKVKTTDHRRMLADMQSSQEVVEFMIEEAEFLFVSDFQTYEEFIEHHGTRSEALL